MVNYQQGKIYKIVCNTTGLVYIGSTAEPTLARRLAKHSSNFKGYQNGKDSFMTSFKVLENNNFEIILLESYPCTSKDELHAREKYFIENNECVNKYVPTRTPEEYKEKYREKLLEKRKENYRQNIDKVRKYCQETKERRKQYYKQNIEKIKQYREANKNQIQEKRSTPYT